MTAKEYKTELIRLIHEAIVENKQEAYDKLASAWDNYEQQLCREQRKLDGHVAIKQGCNYEIVEMIVNNSMPEI